MSEFLRVVGGLQQLVARDGESAGHVGGDGGGSDHGAVLGSGHSKEEAEPGGDLAVGRGRKGGVLRELYRWGLGGVV